MKKALLPLNISLLDLTPEKIRTIREVSTLDILEGPGGNFHDDGLFSTLTFGRIGDPERDRRFGYINLKLPILHPIVFKVVSRLRGLYGSILSGSEYATWNPTTKDFDKSNELEGRTGYQFFMEHWPELDPPKTGSFQRDLNVDLINKYRDRATMSHLLVMPAGLRDAEIDPDGRLSSDEINDLYQNVLMLVRNFPNKVTTGTDLSTFDRTRYTATLRVQAIYDHIERLISGKGGFIQKRWASRRVFNGTRNVISSLDTSVADMDAPNRPKFNDTVVGLYQASKAILPKTIYALKNSVVGEIFNTTANTVELVDPQSLKRTWVEISNQDMDRWATEEGLDKVVNELSVVEKRDRPIMVANHYLALVYVDDQSNYRILRCITDLPEHLDAKWVRPITYVELIYLAGLDHWSKVSGFVTRYPVENAFSSYPTKMYVKTTIVGEMRYALDADFNRMGPEYVALEYPVIKPGVVTQYHDSLSVSPSRLAALGGDRLQWKLEKSA